MVLIYIDQKSQIMPNKKIEIMETRRILRLYESGKSQRFIAEYLGISRNTVIKYISFYKVCGRSYEEITRMSDQQLNELFEPKVYILPEKLQKLQLILGMLNYSEDRFSRLIGQGRLNRLQGVGAHGSYTGCS